MYIIILFYNNNVKKVNFESRNNIYFSLLSITVLIINQILKNSDILLVNYIIFIISIILISLIISYIKKHLVKHFR